MGFSKVLHQKSFKLMSVTQIPTSSATKGTQMEPLDNMTLQPEILYLSLTFDSILPKPLLLNGPDIPPPDLSKFTSPYDWSPARKSVVLTVSCIATCFASFAASCYSPGVEQMASEWNISEVACLVGITTFCCGFAVGPMFLAPFSEITGRKPVFVATAALLAVCQLCCAVTGLYSG